MSLKKESILLSASSSLQVLITLIFSIFITRIISDKADIGRYQQVFILINFLSMVMVSIPNSLSYFASKHDNNHWGSIFKRFFFTLFLTTAITILLFLLLNNFLAGFLDNFFINKYGYIIAGIILVRLMTVYFVNFSLLTNTLYYFTFSNVGYLFFNIGLMVIVYFFNWNMKAILLGQLVIDSVRFIVLLPGFSRHVKEKNNWIVTKEEFNYTLPLFLVAIISNLYLIIDRMMISSMLGPAAFADYQIGAFVFPFISIISGSVITALLPRISKYYHEGNLKPIVENIHRATDQVAILLVPIFVYCTVFGQEIITWLYSDKYVFSGYIFQIYTLRFFGSVILFSMLMSAIGLQTWVFINTVVNLIATFILNYLFIKYFGVMGAVYAGILSTYLGYILPVLLVNRKLKASLFDYFPGKNYLKILAVSIFIAIIFKFVYQSFINIKIVAIVLSVIYYALVVFILDRKTVSYFLSKVKNK